MNTNSKTKKNLLCTLLALLTFAPMCSATAQEVEDEFGIWTTVEASKKINKKFKAVFEGEFRTMDALSEVERYSIGARIDYKINKLFKTNAGYSFIYNQKPDETSIKEAFDESLGMYDYNVDHAYWTVRNRFYVTLQGEYKIGRFEIGLRERLQYTRTNSTSTDETKYRWGQNMGTDGTLSDPVLNHETEKEYKDTKENTTVRSRLNIKYDIPNCKINPFVSVELYTRVDEWKGCDKLRYRIGGSYKINKDNSISLFYLYQDANDDDEPKGHAIGFEYSIDL